MRLLPLAALMLFAAGPALAAEATAEGAAGTHIDMPFLMAPINGADGKLTSYAYIASRLTADFDTSANVVRDKIAFIQDAFVRDVNGAPVVRGDDLTKVDTAGLQARLLADARRIMGGGKVVSIAIVQLQIAPLHPVQSPDAPPQDDAPPEPAAAPAK